MAFLGSHWECNCGAPDSGDTCTSQGGPPTPALCQNLLLGSFSTTHLASKLCTLVQVGWDRILSDRTYQLEPEKNMSIWPGQCALLENYWTVPTSIKIHSLKCQQKAETYGEMKKLCSLCRASIYHQPWVMGINAHPISLPRTLIISSWELSPRNVLALVQISGVRECDANAQSLQSHETFCCAWAGIRSSLPATGRPGERMALGLGAWWVHLAAFLWFSRTLHWTQDGDIFLLTNKDSSQLMITTELSCLCLRQLPIMVAGMPLNWTPKFLLRSHLSYSVIWA